jgi:hypothetical protein
VLPLLAVDGPGIPMSTGGESFQRAQSKSLTESSGVIELSMQATSQQNATAWRAVIFGAGGLGRKVLQGLRANG